MSMDRADRNAGQRPWQEDERPPEERRREELARRAEEEAPGPLSDGESDVLPEVEVPEHQM
jgi:hypothetical protein